MFGISRTGVRIASLAFILALSFMALPVNRMTALAYVGNAVFVNPSPTYVEGQNWPDPANAANDGVVAYFSEVNTLWAPNGSGCPLISTYTSHIQWGDGQTTDGAVFLDGAETGSGYCRYAVKGHHTYLEEGSVVPTVSIHSSSGSDVSVSPTQPATLMVADAPLTDVNGGVGAIIRFTEGHQGANQILGTFTDGDQGCSRDDYAVEVDWGDGSSFGGIGNGVSLQAVPSAAPACEWILLGTHTYLEEGNFHLNVSVVDHNSAVSLVDTGSVTDAVITGQGNNTLYTTESKSTGTHLLGTFTDADPGCASNDYHVSVDWGDGTTPDANASVQVNPQQGAGPCSFAVYDSHTFADPGGDEGTYTGTVTINDNPASGTFTFSTVVADAPLNATGTGPFSGFVEGKPNTVLIGTFHDTNDTCPTIQSAIDAEYTVTVNWGDGVTSTLAGGAVTPSGTGACNYDVNATHTYHEQNAAGYPVSASVVDNQSATSFTASAVVADAALTDITDPVFAGIEGNWLGSGTPPVQYVGTFHDQAGNFGFPADCDIHDYTANINWGDGTTTSVTSTTTADGYLSPSAGDSCNFDVFGSHIYRDEGQYSVTVTVHDQPFTTVKLGGVAGIPTIDDAHLSSVGTAPSYQFNDSGGTPVVEGQTINNLYLGTFQDSVLPGYCDIKDFSVTINWGDGAVPGTQGPETVATSANGGIVPSTIHPGPCNFDVLGTYTYAEESSSQPPIGGANPEAPYSVSLTLRDAAPGCPTPTVSGCTPKTLLWTTNVDVLDAPLQTLTNALPSSTFNPVEGKPFTLQYLGTFQDGDKFCNANDYTVAVNWGDGTPVSTYPAGTGYVTVAPSSHSVAPCSFDAFGSHTYAEEGIYGPSTSHPVSVTITDHVQTTSWQDTANVSDALLSDVRDNNFQPFEGIQFNSMSAYGPSNTAVPLAVFSDGDPFGCANPPGPEPDSSSPATTPYSIQSIDWGDGVVDTNVAALNYAGSIVSNGNCTYNVNGIHTYHEESEPNVPYNVTIVVKDVGGSTISLHPTATVVDAPLSAGAGSVYQTIDSSYTNWTVNGSTNPTSACWLQTSCSRVIATFTDTGSYNFPNPNGGYACNLENEPLAIPAPPAPQLAHFTASIDWGDGSLADTNPAHWQIVPSTKPGAPPCTFDVVGTHIYTTLHPFENAGGTAPFFDVTVQIMDEGGAVVQTGAANNSSDSQIAVGYPDNQLPKNGVSSHLVAQYSYPPGSLAPTYVLTYNLYQYTSALGWVGALRFQDKYHFKDPNGLFIPKQPAPGMPNTSCSTSYSFTNQCNLAPLSQRCVSGPSTLTTPAYASAWNAYRFSQVGPTGQRYTGVKYVRIDLKQYAANGLQDDFRVTMSGPTSVGSPDLSRDNWPNGVISTPAVLPSNSASTTTVKC